MNCKLCEEESVCSEKGSVITDCKSIAVEMSPTEGSDKFIQGVLSRQRQ